MTRRITVDVKPSEPITLALGDKEYIVRPPKSTIAMAMVERFQDAGEDASAIRDEIDRWIGVAFGKKQGAKVRERLDNPEDDLDLPHIVDAMTKLAEAVTPTPST